jgi:hypothetical protein
VPLVDPGSEVVIDAAMNWLCLAQDASASRDGGVARDYNLRTGWASSYPETTGYIVPTFLDFAAWSGNADARVRAQRMLDWLVRIQMPCGAFQGGKIDSTPVVPVPFNTGQIVLGLAAGEIAFGRYRDSLRRAADWLVANQDADGCWRNHQSPFAIAGDCWRQSVWSLEEATRSRRWQTFAGRSATNEATVGSTSAALAIPRNPSPTLWVTRCAA